MNTIGHHLRFTSFGESHGQAIGGVLDGFPARFTINTEQILTALQERAGEGVYGVSPRATAEPDQIEWLSGLTPDKVTLGTPIAFIVRNQSVRPQDYSFLQNAPRPTHADEVYANKYGMPPQAGGGRASGRETVSRVVAGCLAEQWLCQNRHIHIAAAVHTVGGIPYPSDEATELLQTLQNEHDSIGATVKCTITYSTINNPQAASLGDPIFDKLTARLAAAVLSIGGTTGITFEPDAETKRATLRNSQPHGIIAGIATGQPITFYVTFHATPSVGMQGRHDLCFALRTPTIVRAMAALTLMDLAI